MTKKIEETEIDALLRLSKKRRSIRRFLPDPVPEGAIEKILEVARWAMSGANGQPWEFIVVTDNKLREKIVQIHKDSRQHLRFIEETRKTEYMHPAYATPESGRPSFADAPVFILVCGDLRTLQATVISTHFYIGEGGPHAVFYKNIANATQLIHMAVAALGLGSQWISINTGWEWQLKELLNIPHPIGVHTLIPVGYPAYKPPAPYRRKLSEIVHYNGYDTRKFRDDKQIQEFLEKLRQRTIAGYQVK